MSGGPEAAVKGGEGLRLGACGWLAGPRFGRFVKGDAADRIDLGPGEDLDGQGVISERQAAP
jgi:hypothetical protein